MKKLLDMNVISISGNRLFMAGTDEKNDSLVTAFWVLLQFLDENTKFEPGMYPSEIVFQNDDVVSEIIVCSSDFIQRLDFLSKRKKYDTKCHYYIVLDNDTIDDIDDSLFTDVPLTIVTLTNEENDMPKLFYHKIVSSQKIQEEEQTESDEEDKAEEYVSEEEETEADPEEIDEPDSPYDRSVEDDAEEEETENRFSEEDDKEFNFAETDD